MGTHTISLGWYLTLPSHFNQSTPPICWRNCNQTGTLLHILWSCPALTRLWKEVQNILQDIFHFPLKLTPQIAILNINIESLPPTYRLVTTHILLATRLLIIRCWRTNTTPSLIEVVTLVILHYTYESIHENPHTLNFITYGFPGNDGMQKY